MWLAAAGSAALLLGAYGFQHLGGLAPCQMCLWQRWPHALAAGAGVLAIWAPFAMTALLGAAGAATTAGIGVFHAGVEQGLWEGPATCSAGSISGLSVEDLMATIMAAPVVRCDEIAWQWLGLSMAGWNAALSLGLAALWLTAVFARGPEEKRA